MSNILLCGYFERGNLGDDLFKDVYTFLFKKESLKNHRITFVSIDDLKTFERKEKRKSDLNDYNVIILAGGDILNDYFLFEMKRILTKCNYVGKVYAFSVGIPYQVVLVSGLLNIFNFFICRSITDACTIRKNFGEDYVRYFPDISVYVPQMFSQNVTESNKIVLFDKKIKEQKNVGVFLIRTIFKNNSNYELIVKNLAKALDKLLENDRNLHMFLIPFNTFKQNIFENDILINNDVFNLMTSKRVKLTPYLTTNEMYVVFKNYLDYGITMRYHSHMYSIVTQTPFISLYTTRKVKNLLSDVKLLPYSYELPLNKDDLPVDLSVSKISELWNTMKEDTEKIKNTMKVYLDQYASFDQFEETIVTLINNPPDKQLTIKPKIFRINTINNVIESLVRYIYIHENNEKKIYNETDIAIDSDKIFKGQENFYSILKKLKKADIQQDNKRKLSDFLSSLACFGLIHIPYPKYHYGMSKKILEETFNVKPDFLWVWEDYQKSNEKFFIENQIIRASHFNATFVGIEDLRGCHRSGWQYVINNLMTFHSESTDLIFDNYIDRTFHWAHDVYKYTKIIPFTKKWCGFIHHTFNTEFSPYNVPNLFKNETFIESLKYCFALFVLSEDLERKLRAILDSHGFSNILIKSFVHPTEASKITFSIQKFIGNKDRKVVQIGAWLRDNYGIYKLQPLDNNVIKKAALRGRHMYNYFKPDNLKCNIEIPYEKTITYDFEHQIEEENVDNKFVYGILKNLHDEFTSVTIIDTLDNDNYDKLLSENIVFLKNVDASAVNTVIECIVRNTPILVNKLPALVEILGESYPFYYNNMIEAGNKVSNLKIIKETNEYLESINKKKFTMDYFLQDVDNWFRENKNN